MQKTGGEKMKNRILMGLIGVLSSMFLVSGVYANILYNNGAPNELAGKEFTQYIVTQEFMLPTAQAINGVKFWAFDGSIDGKGYQGQITYFIYDDNAGYPGTELASGTLVVNAVYTGHKYQISSETYSELMFNITIPEFNAAANRIYHLGLKNGPMSYMTRENFYWSSTGSKGTPGIIWNLFGDAWYIDENLYEEAFQLLHNNVSAPKPLYFPHIGTSLPWQTEIAVINTGSQTVTGTLKGFSDEGQLVDTQPVNLPAQGRRQIAVADEFTDHTNIGYIIFEADSDSVQGYTKFYQEAMSRVAVPAVKEVNTSDINVPHIASSTDWWTGISLVNTTSAAKVLTITFNNGQSRKLTLNANEHKAFTIASLFNNQPQPNIESAVIKNASGIIGLELFGSLGWGTQLEGILLTDKTTSTIYYPHVASDDYWWTGIVAYNPSDMPCTITITPYSALGTVLPTSNHPIPRKGKYIGAVAALDLPDQTAWFRIDSTSPLSGFELFGTVNGNQLGAYAGGGGTGAKAGVFAKIEKNGWTGIAFVNTEANAASVLLNAYDDNGTVVATQTLSVGGYAKLVNNPELIFSQDISSATYIAYSSDMNIVGFQLNGSADGTMLDGLPGI
jgi:hypothetical protein